MTILDLTPPFGMPRPVLSAIGKLASQILSLSGPAAPRLVVCDGGFAAEALSHDEIEWLHNQIGGYDPGDWVPRLLATVEALREVVS